MKWRPLLVVLQGLAIGAAAACYDPAKPGEEAGEVQCPTDDDDNACQVCAKQNCCAELTECQGDADCDCVADCVGAMGVDQEGFCLGSCGLDELPEEYDALSECGNEAHCSAACG